MAFSASMSDATNFFEFSPMQVYHGPVELNIPSSSSDTRFFTRGKRNRGYMAVYVSCSPGTKTSIEIPFVHIENVMVCSSTERPVIAMQLSEFAAENFALRVNSKDKTEHIILNSELTSEEVLRKLIFVLRPYKLDRYVKLGAPDEQSYGGVEELCERFGSWVRMVRDRDLIAKEQRQAEKNSCTPIPCNWSSFFERCSREDWIELLHAVHLFEKPDKIADGAPYTPCPPEPQPSHPPRIKMGKLYSRRHTFVESDANYESNSNVNIVASRGIENGFQNQYAVSPSCASTETGAAKMLDDHQSFQMGIMNQNNPQVVTAQGRSFLTGHARLLNEDQMLPENQQTVEVTEKAQWLQPLSVVQFARSPQQYVVAGNTLRPQPMVLSSQQHPLMYQLTSQGQTTSLLKAQAAKMDSPRVVIVNNANATRLQGGNSTSQATVATVLKRSLRSSSRLRKEVETIAIDDDDEACLPNTSKATTSEGGENESHDPATGEPSEKRPRVEDQIKDEVLIVFPPGETGAVSLHFEDLRVLAHGEMLNDNIIEFYLKYIRAKLVEKESRDKVFVFNTFFYQRLTEKQPSISILNKNHRSSVGRFEWIKRNFFKVKSWTKKVDIFNMDYIVLPINDEMHWYLVIIVKPALAIVTQRSEDVDLARKRGSYRINPDTYIVILDSLPDPNDVKREAETSFRKCVLDILRDYLECELADKHGSRGDVYLDRTRIGALYPQGVPHQENYVDCGLYLLQFAEAFLTKPPTGKMLKEGARWKSWYPWFDHAMYFMRDKICTRLKGLCNKKAWQRLEAYERQQGRGISIETTSVIIERARRPRRHSETRLREPHPRLRKRTHSEPPNIKKCAPPAPRMVP